MSDYFTIWFGSDYLILAIAIYAVSALTLDLKFKISKRIVDAYGIPLEAADIFFIHLIVMILCLLLLDMRYDFIHMPILVDYVDGKLSILRARVIVYIVTTYALSGIISSIYLAIESKSRKIRWLLYGLTFNLLALIYFFKTRR